MYSTRPSGARQDTPTDCRHSHEPFDAIFREIRRSKILSSDAKLLHGLLVTCLREGAELTQGELAEELGWRSRQRVWRAMCGLVAAGYVVVKRRGLGLPNQYTLTNFAPEDLAATRSRFDRPRSGHQQARPPKPPARGYVSPQERGRKNVDYRGVRTSGFLETREGHYHDVIRR